MNFEAVHKLAYGMLIAYATLGMLVALWCLFPVPPRERLAEVRGVVLRVNVADSGRSGANVQVTIAARTSIQTFMQDVGPALMPRVRRVARGDSVVVLAQRRGVLGDMWWELRSRGSTVVPYAELARAEQEAMRMWEWRATLVSVVAFLIAFLCRPEASAGGDSPGPTDAEAAPSRAERSAPAGVG